jgi:hypothetical protein
MLKMSNQQPQRQHTGVFDVESSHISSPVRSYRRIMRQSNEGLEHPTLRSEFLSAAVARRAENNGKTTRSEVHLYLVDHISFKFLIIL